jgi:uncharacterized damage-inducible protein DinB
MRTVSPTLLAAATLVLAAGSVRAQAPSSITKDMLADIAQVERKVVGLARAIPEERYSWTPGEGVRTVREVLLHVASDNWLIPATMGFAPDPATGIRGDDYKTAGVFEKRDLGKDAVIAELERSFANIRKSLGETSDANLAKPVSLFGQPFTTQRAWLLAVTHLHEHLGQLIAYARSNDVVPPWSR